MTHTIRCARCGVVADVTTMRAVLDQDGQRYVPVAVCMTAAECRWRRRFPTESGLAAANSQAAA